MNKRTPKLGQHFLTGTWAAEKLAGAVGVHADETILEIGPGTGVLTRELLKTGARVVAIEKDGALVAVLRTTFADEITSGRLELIEGDVRGFSPEAHALSRYVLAANIPYYITGEILRQFLEATPQPRAMALLMQKEVAQRILAGNGKESILSISIKAYGKPRIVASVSRGNFSPPPSVDSAILLVADISKGFFDGILEREFFRVLRAGFSSKRKFLASNLSNIFEKEAVRAALVACGTDEKVRAEDITLAQWHSLARILTSPGSASTR